jgi:hypothetical protein
LKIAEQWVSNIEFCWKVACRADEILHVLDSAEDQCESFLIHNGVIMDEVAGSIVGKLGRKHMQHVKEQIQLAIIDCRHVMAAHDQFIWDCLFEDRRDVQAKYKRLENFWKVSKIRHNKDKSNLEEDEIWRYPGKFIDNITGFAGHAEKAVKGAWDSIWQRPVNQRCQICNKHIMSLCLPVYRPLGGKQMFVRYT